jgi:hypothetical protein
MGRREVHIVDGWNVRVTTLDRNGRPALYRHYFVFEGDRDQAIVLVRMDMSVNRGETIELLTPVETIELLAPVARDELHSQGMKPGDVKQVAKPPQAPLPRSLSSSSI